MMSRRTLEPESHPGATPDALVPVEVAPMEIVDFGEPSTAPTAPVVREIAEFVDEDSFRGYPPFPHPLKHPWRCACWLARTAFSIAALIALLAVIAPIPIASIFVLGYLLEVEGRVARTGKLRYGFPLLNRGQRIATIVPGVGLWLVPIIYISNMAVDAALIDPGGTAAARWLAAKWIVSILVGGHLCLALARGGGFGCFVRPIKNLRWFLAEIRNRPHKKLVRCPDCGELLKKSAETCTLCARPMTPISADPVSEVSPQKTYWQRADRKVREFIGDFRVRHHFLLGCRGLVGALAVLLVPTLLFAAATSATGPAILATLFGGFCLTIVFLYVPFLQARLAAEGRLSAMWELGEVRRLFRYAPVAWFVALLFVYALALPLYLTTVVLPPSDAMWLITPIFVMSIYPARVLTGWAYARAARKRGEDRMAWWGSRWGSRFLMFATTVFFTLLFFFTRDISEHGRLVLFEHHAFLGTTLSSLFSLLP
ncbi:MAG: DUF4013 domain-containing protein [Planctomycetaceae bacterium]